LDDPEAEPIPATVRAVIIVERGETFPCRPKCLFPWTVNESPGAELIPAAENELVCNARETRSEL